MWVRKLRWGLFQVRSECPVALKTEAAVDCWDLVSWRCAPAEVHLSPLLKSMRARQACLRAGEGLGQRGWGTTLSGAVSRNACSSSGPSPLLFCPLIVFLCFLLTRILSYSTFSSPLSTLFWTSLSSIGMLISYSQHISPLLEQNFPWQFSSDGIFPCCGSPLVMG